jgi:hypothetical protein
MTIAYAIAGFILITTVSFLRGTNDNYQDLCVGAVLPVISILLLPLVGLLRWLAWNMAMWGQKACG